VTTRRAIVPLMLAALLAGSDAHAQSDSTPARPRAVVIDPAHERRLGVHRWTAYAVPPLFAVQALVGQQLYRGVQSSAGEAEWVRPTHRAGAVLIGSAFAVNVTTGAWNLWSQRHEPEGRVMRLVHGASMLAAAGGFTYAGTVLAQDARVSLEKRREHRRIALGSMVLTLASGTGMWLANR